MKDSAVDVLVVGAGPAGSTTATLLAREGVGVVVIDRSTFPRDKICGDGLAPRSVAMLRRLGLEDQLRTLNFRPASGYRVVSSWGESVRAGMPAFGKGAGYAYVVPRRELDALMVANARDAGAVVLEGVRALRCSVDGQGLPVVAAVGPHDEPITLRSRVLVAADGSRGSFSRTVMSSDHLEPDAVAIRAYVRGVEGTDDALSFFLDRTLLPGYGWVFPSGRPGGPANVGLGLKVSALRRRPDNLRALFDWFMSPSSMAWPYLRRAELISPPATFPLQLDFPRGRRRLGSTLFAGDVANLIDPMSGEGIAYALESGAAAAQAVSRSIRSGRRSDLARYDATIWRELSLEFLGAYLLRQVLVRPWGNGLVVRLLQRDEALARGGMGLLSNSVPATWLLRPLVWRKVFTPERVRRVVGARSPAAG